MPSLRVLYEDNHLLVIDKPAGLATMGTAPGQVSLLSLAKESIKERHHKPGNVYLGVVSRLDSLVSGVIVFARTSKAAARLNQQFQTRDVKKTYWALVEGISEPSEGEWHDFVLKNDSLHRMEIVKPEHPEAKEAILRFQTLKKEPSFSHLEVQLLTGRKHQIRLQFAHHGHPILGDRKYGSLRKFPDGIALHSRELQISHPVGGERMIFEAMPPVSWRKFGF